MREYTTDAPVFSDSIPIVEENDLVNAENDNAAALQLLQNILVLKQTKVDKEEGKGLVSDQEKAVWNALYEQLTGYTDKSIADLINGAPETRDTLGEIAAAMKENEDVVKALHDAIGSKADLNEMESLLGMKLDKTGDAKDVTVSYESSDTTAASSYTEVPVLTGKEKFKEFCSKVSTMFKNIRYLRRLLGTTDISKLGDGTVTGALSALNTGLAGKAPSSHRHSWENITDKPSTFPPINHSHSYLPITGGNISGNLIVDGNIQGGSWLMSTNCLGTKNSFAIMSNDKNRITLIWTGTQLDLYVDSHRMGKFSIN